MTPRVSIIMPYRNSAAYMADAIDSVLVQSVGDWELLLVDDHSTDESASLARRYAERDRRIRTLDMADRDRTGAAAARNVGLQAARGEFVAFLDSDDLFMPDKLEQELILADRHPNAALICGAARWWHPGNEQADWIDRVRYVRTGLYEGAALLEQLILLNRDEIPCICAVLARRDAALATGGFEEGMKLYEDQSLLAKLLARHSAYLGGHLTSIYRQHEKSTSAAAQFSGEYDRKKVHPARAPFLDWIEEHLETQKLATPRSRRALRVARAISQGSTAGLSLAERLHYFLLIQERFVRRVVVKLRNLRRGQTRAPRLPR